jgi:hypothetical protein
MSEKQIRGWDYLQEQEQWQHLGTVSKKDVDGWPKLLQWVIDMINLPRSRHTFYANPFYKEPK